MDEARARRSKKYCKKGLVGLKSRCVLEVKLMLKINFDVPILYGPGISNLQSETNDGNLFDVPISYDFGISTLQIHNKNSAIIKYTVMSDFPIAKRK